MNKQQKTILINVIAIVVVTAVAVVAMINFKDWVNRSEAMRAMEHLSQIVQQYREAHGLVPPEQYVESAKETLEGHLRLGRFEYRAIWLDLESTDDEILAYAEKKYHLSFFNDGFVVLRFDGRVEWMARENFETLFAAQKRPMEPELK